MKIQDIEKVNHLIAELNGMKELIEHARNAEPADFEAFIKLPGDASIRLSVEGAASTLGATPRVIRRQFLVEASMLGLAGGVTGLVVGAAGSRLLSRMLSQPVTISGQAAGAALAVALIIGIAAGVYPAGASRLMIRLEGTPALSSKRPAMIPAREGPAEK